MQKIVKAINQCVSLYSKQQYQDVADKLPPLLTKIPFNGQLIYLLAMSERFIGNNEKSEHYFKILIKKDPNNCAYLCGYANLFIAMNSHNKAQQLFEKSLVIDKSHFDTNYNLARLFTLKKNFVEANKYYQASVLINPHSQSAHLGIIDCQSQLMMKEEAIGACLTFIQNNEQNKQIKHKLALLYKEQGEVTLSIDIYKELLSAFPNDYSVNRSYALSCASLGIFDGLAERLGELLMKNPNDFELHECYFYLLWNQEKQGYFTYYERLYKKITNVDILYAFCKKLIKEDSLIQALDVIEYAFLLNIKVENAYLIKGHVLRELGDFGPSLAILLEGNQRFSEHTDLTYELAITYLCLEEYENALKLSKKMTEISPWHQGCWALYASTLRYNGHEGEYHKLYNYNDFVKIYSVPPPARYDSVAAYHLDLLDELERQHKNKRHPIEQSVRNGSQTPNHLFSNASPLIKEFELSLTSIIDQHIKELSKLENKVVEHPLLAHLNSHYFFSGAWSINMNNKGYHKNHYHHKGWISGPYYVVVPDAVNSQGEGWLKVGQAELSRWLEQEADYYIKPSVGDVILFPSYMWHGTVPLTKNQQRVTVAFDVTPQ
ncbi:MAG: tetratricopeptide repeat protein [Colwellia sp.]|nr:tetratricopeptide repeat protein [Colwellia sp.]